MFYNTKLIEPQKLGNFYQMRQIKVKSMFYFLKILFLIMCMPMSVDTHGCQKYCIPLELESHEVVNHLMWTLKTKFKSSSRAVYSLNCWAFSGALDSNSTCKPLLYLFTLRLQLFTSYRNMGSLKNFGRNNYEKLAMDSSLFWPVIICHLSWYN